MRTRARLPKSPLRRRLGHGEIERIGRRIATNRLHAGSGNPDQLRHRSASQAAHCRRRRLLRTVWTLTAIVLMVSSNRSAEGKGIGRKQYRPNAKAACTLKLKCRLLFILPTCVPAPPQNNPPLPLRWGCGARLRASPARVPPRIRAAGHPD